jgi:hypothetical protein
MQPVAASSVWSKKFQATQMRKLEAKTSKLCWKRLGFVLVLIKGSNQCFFWSEFSHLFALKI